MVNKLITGLLVLFLLSMSVACAKETVPSPTPAPAPAPAPVPGPAPAPAPAPAPLPEEEPDDFNYDDAFAFRAKKITLKEASNKLKVKVPVPAYLPEGYDIQGVYIGVSNKTIILLIFDQPIEQRAVEPPDEPKDYPINYIESPQTQMYVLYIFFDGRMPVIEATTPGVNSKINEHPAIFEECEQYVIFWSMELEPEDSKPAKNATLQLIAEQKLDKEELIKIAESIR